MELGGGEGRGERKGVFSPRPGILHSLRLPQTRASIWASASRHPLPSRRLSLATAPPPFCSSFCFSLSLSIRHYGRRNACLLSFFFPPPKVDQTETRSSASIALFLIGRDGGGGRKGSKEEKSALGCSWCDRRHFYLNLPEHFHANEDGGGKITRVRACVLRSRDHGYISFSHLESFLSGREKLKDETRRSRAFSVRSFRRGDQNF